LLFSKWRGENVGTFTKVNLKQYAASLNLDAAKFNPCIDGDQTMSIVQNDINEATRLRITGTPTFLVNNQQLQLNSLDYSQFAQAFDARLK
jgi:protein-disulfide isomerase